MLNKSYSNALEKNVVLEWSEEETDQNRRGAAYKVAVRHVGRRAHLCLGGESSREEREAGRKVRRALRCLLYRQGRMSSLTDMVELRTVLGMPLAFRLVKRLTSLSPHKRGIGFSIMETKAVLFSRFLAYANSDEYRPNAPEWDKTT